MTRRWRKGVREYSWARLGGDAAGGLAAALIALPYGLALATLMGLPPLFGVLTSILGCPICVIFGRNPVLIGGVSSVTVPFILAAVRHEGIPGAAKVSIAAAIFMIAFGFLRLGRYVSKVPPMVVAGFSCGIGGMMVISQLPGMLGLRPPAGGWSATSMAELLQVAGQILNSRLIPILLSVVVLVVASWVVYRSPKIPALLCGILAAIIVARVFGWREKELGMLSVQLAPFAGFRWEGSDFYRVLPDALGMAFVTSVNLLITSRVVVHFRGRQQHFKKQDADMEVGAYGIANLFLGTFGVPPCVGIPARSIASVQCGATTRLSNLFHGIFLLGFLVLGARFIAQIPLAALAGVTAFTGARLLEWSTWGRLRHMGRVDAAAFMATAFAVLMVNAIAAVAIGCSFYLLRGLWHRISARPKALVGDPAAAEAQVGGGRR